ncbi:Solute carrier family 22 member 5 [Nymphon striatum]|nr:Solute carrier family 22 member 5 [Nymphon striatum]
MDVLTSYIGEFGRWQMYIFMVASGSALPSAMHTYAMTFFAPTLDFWCARPDHLKDKISAHVWRNYSSPLEFVEGKEIRSQCRQFDWNYNYVNETNIMFMRQTETIECQKWEFDNGIYQRTMREEFNLVCSRDILISTSNAVYMAAFMISVTINGHLADRFGRRIIILVNMVFLLIFSIAIAFSKSFTMVIVLRVTEVCSEKHRAVLGNLFYWAYAFGIILLSGFAYAIPNWFLLQFVMTVPYAIFLVLF